jgi:hypothetical protein|tara:strand:+ start:1088 stop:2332 length:1245 start_codon:yes stop_codon:yes gene_type:complete
MVVRKSMQEEREYLPDVYPSVDQIERTHINGEHYNTELYFLKWYKHYLESDIDNITFVTPQEAIQFDLDYFKEQLDKGKIVIDNSLEAETTTFHRTIAVLKDKEANLSNLFILVSGFQLRPNNDSVKFVKDFFGATIIHWPFWFVNEQHTMKKGGRPANDELQDIKIDNKRNKKFVCLNNYFKPHRMGILIELYKNNLLDEGYVSARWGFDPEDALHKNLITLASFDDEMNRYGVNFVDEDLKSKFPMLLDDLESNKDQALYENFQDRWMNKDWILDSMINVVTESFYNDDFINNCNILEHFGYDKTHQEIGFITEKTIKPIALCQPFMVIGNPGITKYLNSLGFTTFNNLFSRYDVSENIHDRVNSVIYHLNTFEGDTYDNVTQQQLVHNREHFFKEDFVHKILMEVLDKING